MTDQNDLLENCKKEIRSILLPEQQGLDVARFLKNYNGLIGRQVPYRELGFQKVEDLLKRLPDVVSLKWSFETNSYILRAVADESTKHIQKLVQKQRTSKPKIKPMQRFRPMSRYQTYDASWSSHLMQNSFIAPRFKKSTPSLVSATFSAARFSGLPHPRISTSQYGIFVPSPIRSVQSVSTPTAPVSWQAQSVPTLTAPVIRSSQSVSTPTAPVIWSSQSVSTPTAPVIWSSQSVSTPTAPVVRSAQSVSTPTAPVIPSAQCVPASTAPIQKRPLSAVNQEVCELVKEHADGIKSSDLQQAFKNKYFRNINFETYDFESFEDYLEQVPGLRPKKFNDVLKIVFVGSPKIMSPVPPPSNTNPQTNKVYTWLTNGENPVQTPEYVPPDETSDYDANGSDDNYYEDEEHDSEVSEKLKKQFREILQRHPRGIFARDFPSSFKVYTGNDFNLRALGYSSLLDFVDTLPDVFTRVQPKNCKSDWLLFDATSENAQKQISEVKRMTEYSKTHRFICGGEDLITREAMLKLHHLVHNQISASAVEDMHRCAFQKALIQIEIPHLQICETVENPSKSPKVFSHVLYGQVIANVRKILQGYSEGIFLDAFIDLYCLNCDTPLNVRNFGYDSLEKFLLRIEDEVPLKIDYYTNLRPKIFLAYDAVSDIPSINTRKFCANLYEPPKDAILPGAKYAAQILPSVPKGTYMTVYTGTIINPAIMWIQLVGETTSHALTILMDEMEQLYLSDESKNYIMRDQDIVAGAVGAGIYSADGNWYRICIVSVDMDFVLATFVDYGNIGRVPKTSLRYLKKEFINLPSQAIRARMAFLFPPAGKEWGEQVRDRLIQICKDKPMMAEIIDSPQHKGVISLFLCDCTGVDDVYLTLVLVTEGYAQYCEDDKPEPEVNVSSDMNFHQTSPTATNKLQLTEVMQAMNTLSQFYNSVSPTASTEKALGSFAQRLNISNPQPVATQSLALYGSTSSALVPNLQSGYFNQGPSNLPYQLNATSQSSANSSHLPLHLNLMAAKDAYSRIETPKMQQSSATRPNYIRPPINPSQEICMSALNDDDYSEIFDDDDDEFDKLCEELGCVMKYVQRVDLKFNHRIHIIVLESTPYVSAGDLSYLFWPNEAHNLILRRLQQNNSSLPSKTVFEEDYPILFQQLQCLKVKGLLKAQDKFTVTLFLLEYVEEILNLFGHPSPTIRSEIKNEFNQFDASSDMWKSFSDVICEDDSADKAKMYTDSDKFLRMCVYDLKATMEGLKYRKLTCEKLFEKDPSAKDELEKVNRHFYMYDRRIKEIATFTT